jgi:sugar phosphate isomerase/epimerase
MYMNRRDFLQSSLAFATVYPLQMTSNQTFKAGIVPSGKTVAENSVQEFWAHCDEVAAIGVHRIEFNNTRTKVAEYYASRVQEFLDRMTERKLKLTAVAQFSRMGDRLAFQEAKTQHLLLGQFLAGVGGTYITHMIASGALLNESTDEEDYRKINVGLWARHANEVGRELFERWGIMLAYHPEQREVSSGLYERFLEATDERSIRFLADIGHLAAGGADPVKVCKTYRNRLLAVHLKDFAPAPVSSLPIKAGNVPFGSGTVDLLKVVAELRVSNFSGWVLGESGGTNEQMCTYMTQTLGLSFD